MPETLNFGKYKGESVSLVPCDYLIWCAENMATPPKCVVEELARRSTQHGTRQAADAAAAVASLLFKRANPQRKKGRHRGKAVRRAEPNKAEVRAARQRQRAAERLASIQKRPAVGEDFDRLRLASAQAGGEVEDCPFDTPDEPYAGPSLSYSGGRWLIVPPEFPADFS